MFDVTVVVFSFIVAVGLDVAVEITREAAETGTIGIPAPFVDEVEIVVEVLLMLVVLELSVVTVSAICQNVVCR